MNPFTFAANASRPTRLVLAIGLAWALLNAAGAVAVHVWM